METLNPEFVAGLRLQGDTMVMNLPFPPESQYGSAFMVHEAYLAFFDGQRIESRYAWKRWLNTLIACNIYQGEVLQFEFKTSAYNNANSQSSLWSLYALNLDKQRLNKLICDCAEDVRRGLAFNNAVYSNFLLPSCCRYDNDLKRVTFCSEHVTKCLQRIEIRGFEDIHASAMDPTALYHHVRTCELFKPILIDKGKVVQIAKEFGVEII